MTRFNWDRVRMENRIQQHGAEPFFEEHTEREPPKPLTRHHSVHKGKCPHCGKMKVGLTAHIAAKHSASLVQGKASISRHQTAAPPIIAPPQVSRKLCLSALQARLDGLNDLVEEFHATVKAIQNDIDQLSG